MQKINSLLQLTVFIFLVSAMTAFAEITLKVFAKSESREFPEGYEIISTPSETASLIKTMASGSATIAGYADVNGKRYFVSRWSYERFKSGESYNWIRPKEAAKQEPQQYAALTELIRQQQIDEEQSQVVIMPNEIKASVREIVNGVRVPKPILGSEYNVWTEHYDFPTGQEDINVNDSFHQIACKFKNVSSTTVYFLYSLPKPDSPEGWVEKRSLSKCIGVDVPIGWGDSALIMHKLNLLQKKTDDWTKEETAAFEKTCNELAVKVFSREVGNYLLENWKWVKIESKNPKIVRYDSFPDNRYTLISEVTFKKTDRFFLFKVSAFDRNYMNEEQSKKLESTK